MRDRGGWRNRSTTGGVAPGHTLPLMIVTVCIALCASPPALAFDVVAPFDDPLRANPERLTRGAILPGDRAPLVCPAARDLREPLQLVDAVDLALCTNPRIRAAWAEIKLQAAEKGQARAAYLPTLSGTVNFMRTRYSYPGSGIASTTEEGTTVNATLGWRLFDFGGRGATRESANRLLVAALARHDAALQKMLADVIQAYFDAVTAQAGLRAKELSESIALRTFETAGRREDRGLVSRGDRLQAETALAQATLDRNRARGAYEKTMAALVYLIGVAPGATVVLPDDVGDTPAETVETKTVDDWLRIAAETHPLLLAGRAQWESALRTIASTRSEGLPTVDFSANYYQNGYPGQGISRSPSRITTVGLSLTFPFFDGFSRTYRIRSAEARAEQALAELQETERNTLMEVVKAHADAGSSLRNLQASKRLLDIAEESLAVSQRRYEKGAADILELLTTQAALADARQERIRSLAEWNSARLRLLACVGVLGRGALER